MHQQAVRWRIPVSGKIAKVLFLLFLIMLPGLFAVAQNPKGYKLTWSDEFNRNGRPDSSNWTYEKGFVRNQEFQWYQTENAHCANGLLIIEARKEEKPNPDYMEGTNDWRKNRPRSHYTSACLLTRGLRSWQYGRFEIRARIDIKDGLWPARWTRGVNGRWPANGEIDIMEYYRRKLLANIACLGRGRKAEWFSNRFSIDSLGGAAWSEKFHIWRMDWTEKEIALYLDDRLLNKVPLDSLVNKDGMGVNPFRQPHYMLLNLAVGGQNGGDPAHTEFPKRMEVDYVRVYQED
jgi:beta-glucanase (GH16 family)